jgi:site-specific DNA-methyltransferase (adenine-specific)
MKYQILEGDNRETLKTLADNSIDAIVTDPPYGIDFLGKAWDANTGALETYQECLRVLKPGGHILAFSAARTYHYLAVTLEQAGFEIRDQIMWIYSSGFPKSQDVGKSIARSEKKVKNTKTYLPEIDDNRNVANSTTGSPRCQMCDKSTGPIWKKCPDDRADCIKPWQADLQDNEWNGWGTALKPAHEPIALARKPIKGSIKDNVLKHGVGALNIDATRIPYENQKDIDTYLNNKRGPMERGNDEDGKNIRMFNGETGFKAVKREVTVEQDLPELGRFPSNVIGEILQADYQKYFYCPKVSRKERHIGHETPPAMFGSVQGCYDENGERYAVGLDARTGNVGNNHPTVKPIELMKYLIKLITPPGGTVLDPFNGSGSTGCAAVALGHEYIGCELDPNYVEISKKRIEKYNKSENNFDALFE